MAAVGRRRGRRAVLVTAGIGLTVIGLGAGSLYVAGAWGCPSQAELERPRSEEDVVFTFAEHGVALARTPLPRAVSREREYREAVAYRYAAPRATLFVLVCRTRCANAPRLLTRQIRVGRAPQHVRQISALGNNITVFTTDADRRSGARLQARVQAALDALDVAVPYGSRCYVQ
jgi:hypothetical protein